jgi:hypothetical protein
MFGLYQTARLAKQHARNGGVWIGIRLRDVCEFDGDCALTEECEEVTSDDSCKFSADVDSRERALHENAFIVHLFMLSTLRKTIPFRVREGR